ncbi:MAG: YifB family Mg chelatase-like AAA ATPase [Gammaproteobacteria bacterium]|nr:YifB family Mg chelatase-like AAA ATPase [Gammaproteobacteria bacterium]MCB1850248.1 YifB family Mg chelatase-like AAA ATPase [Gammaproteobacteria bacterium]MCP5418598.1 YifB family Mg chelatase-like AAA ATPase [Chromatiaceae bacterium]
MSLAVLYCRALCGVHAPLVTVEVHLTNGLPGLSIVGLPELAVRESKDRVRGALLNSRFQFPSRRITINLAPADLPKEGARFDLPIALGILAASGQIPAQVLGKFEFVGELALSGDLRPVAGALPMALAAKKAGRALILPSANAAEAALVEGLKIHAADTLLQICDHLITGRRMSCYHRQAHPPAPSNLPDLAEVRGQESAKRALEIAAAGEHSLLMIGPPGSGKSMLASRLPGLLPLMSDQEALESAALRSISNRGFQPEGWRQRPFRNPHHTASGVALVGGGSLPKPGEISLAHNGVLFLDELPEFDRRVLEVLREPLENGEITISRASHQAEFPARFQLVAAMNPCPCGYLGDQGGNRCHCSADQVQRYRNRLSGPLLDRIDMHIEVPALAPETLAGAPPQGQQTSAQTRQRVEACRNLQLERSGCSNSRLRGEQLQALCSVPVDAAQLLFAAMQRLGLSARAYHRILRLARTIADLEHAVDIAIPHLSEAIGYRQLDRRG